MNRQKIWISRILFSYTIIILTLCSLIGCRSEKKDYLDNFSSSGNSAKNTEISQDQSLDSNPTTDVPEEGTETSKEMLQDIPEYEGKPYVTINDDEPSFTEYELSRRNFEEYSDMDQMGRCGSAIANVSKDTMPTEERGPIGNVKPSGWHTVKYNDIIDGNYLYNRCHLIGYQLTGQNANERNLITGTRYLNTEGMLPFENMVISYIEETNNHVLYRVTPVFDGENLLASGVIMEAESIEDDGEGVSFHVFVFNVQPGIQINYQDGESRVDPDYEPSRTADVSNDDSYDKDEGARELEQENTDTVAGEGFVINKNTHKFHRPSCNSVDDIKEKNKFISNDSREEIIEKGYEPCKSCNP